MGDKVYPNQSEIYPNKTQPTPDYTCLRLYSTVHKTVVGAIVHSEANDEWDVSSPVVYSTTTTL